MNGRSNGNPIPRDIEEFPSFEHQAAAIEPDKVRLDDMLRGVLFNIARVPELYELQQRPGRLPLCAAIHGGNPRLRIWFTYDASTVILMGIQRV